MSYSRTQEALTAAAQKAQDAYALARQMAEKASALFERVNALEARAEDQDQRIAELEADARRAAREAAVALPVTKQTRTRRAAA